MGRSHGGAGQVQVTPVVARGTDRGPRGDQLGFDQKGGVCAQAYGRTTAGGGCNAEASVGANAHVPGAEHIDLV